MSTARRESVRAAGLAVRLREAQLRHSKRWGSVASLTLALALALAPFVLSALGVAGDELPANLDEQFAARLAAGDFDQARQFVEEAPRASRDRLLARIAVAQAGAGQRQRFADTLDEIGAPDARVQAAHEGRREILAQFPAQQPGQDLGVQNRNNGANIGQQGNFGFGNSGDPGGGQGVDFESLMELITSTVAPTSWDDVGGPGSVKPYPSGVWVDAQGLMARLKNREATDPGQLARLRSQAKPGAAPVDQTDARTASPLRMISLVRLERYLLHQLAAGKPLDETALALAGLRRVQFLFCYPETGDLVLAGPAGDWQPSPGGRLVATGTGRPIVRLDDLIVVLRELTLGEHGAMGCSIVPRTAGLAAAKGFLTASATAPLPAGRKARHQWVEQLREQLGVQTIEFYGLAPDSHAARVLVEADYHMKLVGTGLAKGTPLVPSYLDLVEQSGEVPESLDVLRWWFTLKYEAITAAADRRAFALQGPAVQVLSESELLDAQGQRIHTGKSDPLNSEFARRFTADFAALAERYPVYAELQNVFDLAVMAAVVRHEQLAAAAHWDLGCLGDSELLALPKFAVPRTVETVANHLQLDGKRFVAVVSGGVRLDPYGLLASADFQADEGPLAQQHQRAQPHGGSWWWDVAAP